MPACRRAPPIRASVCVLPHISGRTPRIGCLHHLGDHAMKRKQDRRGSLVGCHNARPAVLLGTLVLLAGGGSALAQVPPGVTASQGPVAVAVPRPTIPQVTVPQVTVPQVQRPVVTVAVPQVQRPPVAAPQIQRPSVSAPQIERPAGSAAIARPAVTQPVNPAASIATQSQPTLHRQPVEPARVTTAGAVVPPQRPATPAAVIAKPAGGNAVAPSANQVVISNASANPGGATARPAGPINSATGAQAPAAAPEPSRATTTNGNAPAGAANSTSGRVVVAGSDGNIYVAGTCQQWGSCFGVYSGSGGAYLGMTQDLPPAGSRPVGSAPLGDYRATTKVPPMGPIDVEPQWNVYATPVGQKGNSPKIVPITNFGPAPTNPGQSPTATGQRSPFETAPGEPVRFGPFKP